MGSIQVLCDHIPNGIHLARASDLNLVNYFTIRKRRIKLIVSIHTKIFRLFHGEVPWYHQGRCFITRNEIKFSYKLFLQKCRL
jgi:hypothetical protein